MTCLRCLSKHALVTTSPAVIHGTARAESVVGRRVTRDARVVELRRIAIAIDIRMANGRVIIGSPDYDSLAAAALGGGVKGSGQHRPDCPAARAVDKPHQRISIAQAGRAAEIVGPKMAVTHHYCTVRAPGLVGIGSVIARRVGGSKARRHSATCVPGR